MELALSIFASGVFLDLVFNGGGSISYIMLSVKKQDHKIELIRELVENLDSLEDEFLYENEEEEKLVIERKINTRQKVLDELIK